MVLPTHDRPDRLGGALASVLAQTYRHLEVLVVDDGSARPVDDVVDRVAGDDRRVTLSRNGTPRGAAAARNVALSRAVGDVITFIDDDDRWLPDKLERQLAYLDAHPRVDIVTSDFEVADESSGRRPAVFRGPRRLLPDHLLWFNLPGTFMCAMLRRSPLQDELWLDESFPSVEDWDFFVRCARRGDIGVVPEPLARQVLHRTGRLSDPSSILPGRVAFRRRHAPAMSPVCLAYNRAHERMELGAGWAKRGNVLRSLRTPSARASSLLLLEQSARQAGKLLRDPGLDCRVLTRAIDALHA